LQRAGAATPLGFLQQPFRPAQVFNAIQHGFAGEATPLVGQEA